MSKRVPVELTKRELEDIQRALKEIKELHGTVKPVTRVEELLDRIKQELERFGE